MCSGQNGQCYEVHSPDRSALSVPVAVSLEVPCYSYNLSSFCSQLQQPSECHCAAFAKFKKSAQQNQEALRWLGSSALHITDTKKGAEVNL